MAGDELFCGKIRQLFQHLIGFFHITEHGKIMDVETSADTDRLSDIGLHSFQGLESRDFTEIDHWQSLTVMSVNFRTMVMSFPNR